MLYFNNFILIILAGHEHDLTLPNICLQRCIDFSKRKAKCEYLIESNSGTCRVMFDFFIITEPIFHKMYPPPPVILSESAFNPYCEVGPTLSNITRVSAFAGYCLTMEATLPPTSQSDCEGHFVNIPALPHSIMVFHNCGASYVCSDCCLSY